MSFTRSGILELHAAAHDCLRVLLSHADTVPLSLLGTEVAGFGRPTFFRQFAHVLTTELSWVRALQLLPIERVDAAVLQSVDDGRRELKRAADATIAYVSRLDEHQLNSHLERYPDEWLGPPRTPAFTLLHVITHAFHHKGQMVAMLRLLGHPAPDTDMARK
jgi:uncharacterized damage-inducible protein DinB